MIAYHFSDIMVGHQDKSWTTHICCNTCSVMLREWLKNKTHQWFLQCSWFYGWLLLLRDSTLKKGVESMKKRGTIQYSNLPSAIRPIPHSDTSYYTSQQKLRSWNRKWWLCGRRTQQAFIIKWTCFWGKRR